MVNRGETAETMAIELGCAISTVRRKIIDSKRLESYEKSPRKLRLLNHFYTKR